MLIFTPIVTLNSRSRVRNEVESRFMRLRCFTIVPNKIYLKESWIASLSLAMTILKIRNVIAKGCICTTVAIHFCYLILFFLPHFYFPMQKWSKMLFNISSVMTSPVISSRASNDAFKSI